MKKERIKDLLFYLMILAVVTLCVYLISFTKSGGIECMENPLVYGVNKMSYEGFDVSCYCTSTGTSEMLFITKDNISYIER